MQRIKWPTVQTDVRRVAVDFQETFAAIMARLAEALQLPEEKLVHIAMMRIDMIRDRSQHHLAPAEAEPAKGVVTQLMLAQALPVRRTVQMLPSDGHHAEPHPMRAATSIAGVCVGAIASAINKATMPSIRWVALRLSGARLPPLSVRITVCATFMLRIGLSCTNCRSSRHCSRSRSAGDIDCVP